MKRDMDLVRSILLKVEAADDRVDVNDLVSVKHSTAEVVYHVRLMQHHGLVDANIAYADDGEYVGWVTALTWDGCDFLDAVRNDGVWKKTKEAVRATVGSTTLDVVKQVAVKVAMGMILAAI